MINKLILIGAATLLGAAAILWAFHGAAFTDQLALVLVLR